MKEYNNPKPAVWSEITTRPQLEKAALFSLVQNIFETIREAGDQAVQKFTKEFDGVLINESRVAIEEIEAAKKSVSQELKDAIDVAAQNIRAFHTAQRSNFEKIETTKGVLCWQIDRPIEKVGIYIPGGSAPLFSTVLMLGIPAIIAGCEEVVLCSPPNLEGNVHPAILYAADLIGIRKIFKVGGVQAIAAMSLGTQSIPQVYKIAGPGNQYVTFAKEYAMRLGIAIDLPAGPSELLVLVNKAANLEFVAADLLSQAEHGEDSQVIAVVENDKDCNALKKEILNQLSALPRKAVAEAALEKSMIIILTDPQDRINFINAYAPEHLIITGEAAEDFLPEIKNAGSIFLGDYSPESAGDYASGTNHTLPTNGAARAFSGVNLTTFLKKITVQKLSKKGLQNIGPSIEIMAEAEELLAHKNAVSVRLKTLKR
jgi:histidinol dehydrogenase